MGVGLLRRRELVRRPDAAPHAQRLQAKPHPGDVQERDGRCEDQGYALDPIDAVLMEEGSEHVHVREGLLRDGDQVTPEGEAAEHVADVEVEAAVGHLHKCDSKCRAQAIRVQATA